MGKPPRYFHSRNCRSVNQLQEKSVTMADVSPEESFDFSSGSSSDKEKFCWTSSNSCFMLLGFFSLFFFNTIPFLHSVVAGVEVSVCYSSSSHPPFSPFRSGNEPEGRGCAR